MKEVKIKINKFRKLLPDALQEIALTPKIQEEILQKAMALYREKYQIEHSSEKEVLVDDNQPIIEPEKEGVLEIKSEYHETLEDNEDDR